MGQVCDDLTHPTYSSTSGPGGPRGGDRVEVGGGHAEQHQLVALQAVLAVYGLGQADQVWGELVVLLVADQHVRGAAAGAPEPLLLFLIAGFIGTIFIGMVIPIFTIQEYIK